MIDKHLLPHIKTTFAPIADQLARQKINANQVTISGFIIGILALPIIATEHYLWGLFFIMLNRTFDGIDGELARRNGTTDQGAFLDISLDFIFYASVPLGFALSNPQNLLPACFLLFSFIGTATSFLAFSLIAEKRGMKSIEYPNKGIYYIGGLTEGFETILLFVLICLFPKHFPMLAYIFGIACLLTTTTRVYYGYKSFNSPSD